MIMVTFLCTYIEHRWICRISSDFVFTILFADLLCCGHGICNPYKDQSITHSQSKLPSLTQTTVLAGAVLMQ